MSLEMFHYVQDISLAVLKPRKKKRKQGERSREGEETREIHRAGDQKLPGLHHIQGDHNLHSEVFYLRYFFLCDDIFIRGIEF